MCEILGSERMGSVRAANAGIATHRNQFRNGVGSEVAAVQREVRLAGDLPELVLEHMVGG